MPDTEKNEESPESEPSQHSEAPPLEGFGEATDYYFNNDGLVVFTAAYLLERGYCCGNGCKNCPYDYKAVPEPKRSKLLEQRRNDEANR